MKSKNTICLWFDKDALDAARFYAATFPNSEVTAVHKAPADYPSGKAGDVLVVIFTLAGRSFMALNGGPEFRFTEAVSFQIETEDQAETGRLADALSAVPEAEVCGWVKDRYGLSWQITPRRLNELLSSGEPAKARRVFEAMMTMRRIDIAAIEQAARAGD